MSETEIDPLGFQFSLEQSIAASHYTVKENAALHLLRSYARLLDSDPKYIPTLGPKYLIALGMMNLVPIREVRPRTQGHSEATNDDQPESGPGAALRLLRATHGPHTRAA